MIEGLWERLSSRPNLKFVVINSGWLIGDKIARLGLGLLIGVWVARYLGPAQYGTLAYAIAVLAIVQAISALGMDSIVVRHIAQSPTTAHVVLGTALAMRLVASALSLFAAAAVGFYAYRHDTETLIVLLLVASGVIFQPADIVDLWYQSQSKSKHTVIAKGMAYASAAAMKVALIVTHAPLWSFAAAQSVELAISAIALGFSYRMVRTNARWTWQSSMAATLLTQSYPMLLSGLSIVVYMKSSQLVISQLLDSRSLGLYSTAQVLSELWYFLPMTIATSVAPAIARRKLASEAEYSEAMLKIFAFMWMLSIGVSVAVCISAPMIVAILFGAAYDESAAVLAIHIFTLIPVSIGVTQSLWLVNENKGRVAIYQALTGAVASISLNMMLVPAFGIKGGAVAILLSQTLQAFVVNMVFAPDLYRLQMRSLRFAATTAVGNARSVLRKGRKA